MFPLLLKHILRVLGGGGGGGVNRLGHSGSQPSNCMYVYSSYHTFLSVCMQILNMLLIMETKDSLPMHLARVTMHYVILWHSTYMCVVYCGFVTGMDKYGHGVLNKTENSKRINRL